MVKIILKFIILIVWFVCAINFFNNYQQLIYDNTKGYKRILAYLLVIFTAPIVNLNNLCISIFDIFLPEGWIVGDEDFYNDQEMNDDDK